ncbi:SCO6880 family protein [Kitasatospora aureofaciens]|uniref:SCO6880 family protein n=1 Tax=Kitasatospora aureofaciens TaxID=1894 RepID=UPI001900DC76|nr:SCO6880 family protein [Kitasatospora aureofaciens]
MSRSFVFPRPRPRGLLGRRLEADEQWVLGGGVLAGLLALWLGPSILLKLLVFVLAVGGTSWATLAPWQGRTFLKWYEIRRTHRRLLRDGRLLYQSLAPKVGRRWDGSPRPVQPPPGVPQLEWINARTAFGDLAILLQPDEAMFTAAIEVEGQQNFGSLDTEDKERLVGAWDSFLKSLADSGGRIRRIQWLSRVVPTDPNAHARDAQERRDPDTPQWLLDSYDSLLRTVAISAEDRRLLLVVGMPYDTQLVAEARRYRTLHEGFGIVLGKAIEEFIRRLGMAQLRWVRNLDEAALASWIHHSYDPSHWINDTDGMDRATAWPAEVDARDPSMMLSRSWDGADPWCSVTAWWKQLPVLPVGINFLAPLLLYVQDVIFTVGVTMDLVNSDDALREAMADVTNEVGQADNKAGRVADPRETKERRTATAAMHDIANGAAGIRLTGWVTLTSPNPELLRQHKDLLASGATLAHLRLEWCDHEHFRAHANTLPLASGLLKD